MKKLMTMIAAVATAFGLFADDATANPGTKFAGLESGTALNVLANDNGETGGTADRYWSYTGETVADDALLIKNDTTPVGAKDDENYLSFKTGSEQVYRNFTAISSTGTLLNPEFPPMAIDDALFADMTIKFGAPADELAIPAESDAKFLASVIDETEAAEGIDALTGKATNLWVIGGFYGASGIENRAFRLKLWSSSGEIADTIDDEWLTDNKRVVIKAYKSVNDKTPSIPGFILYVGDNFATVEGSAPVTAQGAIDFTGYEAADADYLGEEASITQTFRYGKKQLLLPMVTGASLTAVGFQGTGALDSIFLGANVPSDLAKKFEDQVSMTVTLTEGFTGASYTIGTTTTPITGTGATISFEKGSDITVTAVYSAEKIVKWTLGGTSVTPTSNAYTITNAQGGEELNIQANDAVAYAYDSQGNKIPCGSIQDAFDTANVVKVELITSANLGEDVLTLKTGKTLTLDLAGQTITGKGDVMGVPAVIDNLGVLTITNSAVAAGKIIADEEGTVAVQNEDGATLNITAGIYDGDVVQAEDSIATNITATAGSFLKSDTMTKAAVEAFLPATGYRVVEDGDYWKVVAKGPTVAKIGDAEYESLKEAAADAKPGDTVQLIADVNLDATAVFQSTGTNTEAIVLDFNGKTVTKAIAQDNYGIVIADANVKFIGTGIYNVVADGTASASLVMVGVADSAGSSGKPNKDKDGNDKAQFIGRLVVDGNISFMGGVNTSCCIRQEYGYCEIKNGAFDAVAKEDGTKKANGIKASARTGVVTEALISGGTFEIPFKTQSDDTTETKTWPSMLVEGGKFKTVPTDVTGITIKKGCKLKLNTEDGYYYVTPIAYATLAITYDTTIFSDVSVTNAAGTAVEAGQIDIDDVSAAVATYTLDEKYDFDPTSVLAVGPFVQGETFTIELKATAKSSGPVVNPEDAEKGEIKVEGTTATVTLKGDATEIRIEGGLDLTEVDVPVQLKKIRGVNASAIKVKVGDDDITAAFTKTGDGSTGYVELALDPTAKVEIGTETIAVQPTIGENVEAADIKITEGAMAVQAIPGLTYTLVRSTEVGGTATPVDSEKAASTKVSLVDETTKPVDKAFYQITVEAK